MIIKKISHTNYDNRIKKCLIKHKVIMKRNITYMSDDIDNNNNNIYHKDESNTYCTLKLLPELSNYLMKFLRYRNSMFYFGLTCKSL